MLLKSSLLLLFTFWRFQCLTIPKNQTILAVKTTKNRFTLQHKNYTVKHKEILIGKAKFIDNINSTGWSYLEIRTIELARDIDQAYAAGFLEGSLTADLIYSHWYNTVRGYCIDRPTICKNLTDFLTTNKNWISSKFNKYSPYWFQVTLFYKQLDGLHEGYMRGKSDHTPDLSWNDLFWLNAISELDDISQALNPSEVDRIKVLGSGSCSALVKLLPGNKDLLVSHVTWDGYETMLRIQKRYSLRYKKSHTSKKLIRGFDMAFSSSPGTIHSGDDFYLISSGLATMETTIDNYNQSLWSNVKPVGQVLEFVRAMVANRIAENPADWADTFKLYNSGTYNNQWMIINYAAFEPGNSLPTKDVLHVLEQMPGYVVHEDLTGHLINRTYWASYNVAYFPFVFNRTGNYDLEQRYGKWFSYSDTPRARIFARDHVNIHCDQCMWHLMRSNDFKNDPESRCDCSPPYSAENAISARCDLNPANGSYPIPAMGHRLHGATDVKLTTSKLFQRLEFKAVCGPTPGTNNTLGPFCWSKSDYNDKVSHVDQPDCFNFDPVVHQWSL
ncbi:Phospholipase B-like [Cinara cedri]|uniref:Phospholipase B-like n=1 Tax=Cinara cedri TaxID=506608 RepID=A0A5E4N2J9_9HEMI|nr:Phospholipase B-like [Cinara cedri]